MLVSCRYCNQVHNRSYVCSHKPKRKPKDINTITKFRNTSAWKKKRAEIKAADLGLCQLCKLKNRYVFEALDVHHIRPISEAWNDRLTNTNLITLCKACHYRADKGEISRALLFSITEQRESVSPEIKIIKDTVCINFYDTGEMK